MKTDNREFLRHLIDVVWNHVHEDESVPATAVADELIGKAIASQIEEMKSSTNSKVGSAHWFNTLMGKHLRMGEYLKEKTPSEKLLRAWGEELFDTSKELIDGFDAINIEMKPDVVIEGGYVTPLTPKENKGRLGKIRKLPFADLKALREQCEEKMSYQQRRFPKNRQLHKEIYKEQYEIWIEWFSLYNVVLLVMDEYVENLKK